jgi:hypothetical protein
MGSYNQLGIDLLERQADDGNLMIRSQHDPDLLSQQFSPCGYSSGSAEVVPPADFNN